MKRTFVIFTLLFSVMVHAQEAKKTYDDIKATLGSVPGFFKAIPESNIPGVWEDMKTLQLSSSTAIPGKYKELIGLAVSSQIPCHYCVYFHTQAAILNGATQKEVKEAVAMAAGTRKWSTVLYGNQIDEATFRSDLDKIHSIAKKNLNRQAMEVKPVVNELKTPEDAMADIEHTFGFVPTFLKSYPKASLVGAWKDMKAVQLNPDSAIPGKYKDLIGLAVSSQIPCRYCTYHYTQGALVMDNATKEELNEAVALAAFTREMSTYLNGLAVDEKKFRADTDIVIKNLKAKSQKSVTVTE